MHVFIAPLLIDLLVVSWFIGVWEENLGLSACESRYPFQILSPNNCYLFALQGWKALAVVLLPLTSHQTQMWLEV